MSALNASITEFNVSAYFADALKKVAI